MEVGDINLSRYVFGFIFICVVIIGLFIYLWSRNTYKAGIASLLGTLGGFAVGQSMPNLLFHASPSPSAEPYIFLGLTVHELQISSGTPMAVTLTLVGVVSVLIALFGLYLHLENRNIRQHGGHT